MNHSDILRATNLTRHKDHDGFTWYDGTVNGIRTSWEANCWKWCFCFACNAWRDLHDGEPILDSEFIPTPNHNDTFCYGWRYIMAERSRDEDLRNERLKRR